MITFFRFGKKKEIDRTPARNGAENVLKRETERRFSEEAQADAVRSVKILGSGCSKCRALLESTQTALAEMGIPVSPEYITDLKTVMSYGVMSLPALVVNEKTVSVGKVLKPDGVKDALRGFR